MKKTMMLIGVAGMLFLTGCEVDEETPEQNEPKEKQKVTLSMGFIPNVQFAPFYIAQEKGYFAEQNLEVTFDYGMAPDLVQLVGSGERQFAMTDGEQVLIARSQEIPVRSVLQLYQEAPVSIVSLTESAIAKPEDLKGKKVGIPGLYGSSYTALLAYLAEQQMTQDDIQLESIGYTQVESLVSDVVDAVVVFTNNEPIQLRERGYTINEFIVTDAVDYTGAALITSEAMLADDREIVEGVVRAIEQAMAYAIEHPEEAFEISAAAIPDLAEENYPVQRQVLTKSMELWQSEATRENGLGYHNWEIWNATQRTLVNLELVPADLDYREGFTNELLSGEL
ncbi:MAG TPA: ABC transporter substrate-binding protein [bacterium]|nr:ABC transporter substrate-binding protein [bacterium]